MELLLKNISRVGKRIVGLKYVILIMPFLMFFSSCKEKNIEPTMETGSARLEITDAPVDDANIKSVFVTIAEIKVDGESIEGFNKTTIDILAYRNGKTRLLKEANIEAKSYSDITLVLDFDKDRDGNSPGCYVQGTDNVKHKLTSASNEVTIAHNFDINANQQTELVFDFDLRKCIKREENNNDQYEFVSQAEMESGIRAVLKNETGVIRGNCQDAQSNSDKIVVYAYKEGEYNKDTECSGQGESNIEFANAVSSSAVDAEGDFELHFLEVGRYELIFCSYNENTNGNMELTGTLDVDVLNSIDLSSIIVNTSTSARVDVSVTGVVTI